MFLILTDLLLGPASFAQAQQDRLEHIQEYQLKAVFLYNFLHFVYWPEEKCGPDKDGPREIGVIGETPVNDVLKALQAKLLETGEPSLSLVFYGPYREDMDLGGCRLLFIDESEKKNFAKILARLKGEPVLTVADVDPFLEAGGMITLVLRHNKIRWAVNRKPVQQAGLRINAKLLDIAVKVVNGP